jgi:hypothetical protein
MRLQRRTRQPVRVAVDHDRVRRERRPEEFESALLRHQRRRVLRHDVLERADPDPLSHGSSTTDAISAAIHASTIGARSATIVHA